jgi:limonene-1,2-epoxide hydrolase
LRDICERNERTVEKLMKALSGKTPDFDAVYSLFAADGYYWALTPVSPKLHGPQAIVDDLKRQLTLGGDLESMPPHALVSSNNNVVLERTDYVTVAVNQRRAPVRICAVFEFDDAGKITAWREYWDKAHCIEQMGFGGSNYGAAQPAAESAG